MTVAWDMKKLGLLSFVITALIGLSQPAHGGPSDRSEGYYYPSDSTYDSLGRVPTVRQVQLALEEAGYYVGDNRGNFGFETRAAVRRYQRDKGLAITGKIDTTLLKTLGLR
jgi:peptidoglycan hydrolase-like protein with peptidoglycan-binding domain